MVEVLDSFSHVFSIYLINFLIHEELYLEFKDGLNSITGPNDTGKSTILLALEWVSTGKPPGDFVCTTGTKDTSVTVTFYDGSFVSRIREKGKNRYLYGKDNDTKEIVNIGNTVPDEILKALNFDEINFQGQINNIFPFNITPGALGQFINRQFYLDEINNTLGGIRKEEKRLKREQEFLTIESDKTQAELVGLPHIEVIEGVFASAEQVDIHIKKLERILSSGFPIINQLYGIDEKLARFNKKLTKMNLHLRSLNRLSEKHRDLFRKIGNIESVLREFQTVYEQEEESKKLPQINRLAKQINDKPLREIKQRIEDLSWMINSFREVNEENYFRVTQIEELTKERERLLKQLPETCPTCGGPVDVNCMHE